MNDNVSSIANLLSLLAAAAASAAAQSTVADCDPKALSVLIPGDDEVEGCSSYPADKSTKDREMMRLHGERNDRLLSPTEPHLFAAEELCSNEPSSSVCVQNNAHSTNVISAAARNAAKTLKCPKCNWHYKYQETLEIHMREKHGADDDGDVGGTTMRQRIAACIYCQSQQPHPRLGRGETYSCGHKPFQCEVCNYSTTSKGNLSIHMQSDKHLNNVAEKEKQQKVRQSTSLAFSEVSKVEFESQTTNLVTSSTNYTKERLYFLSNPRKHLKSSISSASGNKVPLNRPALPSRRKPVRQSEFFSSSERISDVSAVASNKYRCDLCDYETSFSRNLKIHQSSDKHQQNAIAANVAAAALDFKTSNVVAEELISDDLNEGSQTFSSTPIQQQLLQLLTQQQRLDRRGYSTTPGENLKLKIFGQLLPAAGASAASTHLNDVPPINAGCFNESQTSAKQMELSAFAQKILLQILETTASSNNQSFLFHPQARPFNNLSSQEEDEQNDLRDANVSRKEADTVADCETIALPTLRVRTGQLVQSINSESNFVTSNESELAIETISDCTSDHKTVATANSFLVYQCCVCDNFASDSLEELAKHITADWSHPAAVDDSQHSLAPFNFIEPYDGKRRCSLCEFTIDSVSTLGDHCGTPKHKQLAQMFAHIYYNNEQRSCSAAHTQLSLLLETYSVNQIE